MSKIFWNLLIFCLFYVFLRGKVKNPGWAGGGSLLAEVGTIQLEFGYLSAATNDAKFREAAFKVFDQLDPQNPKLPNLRMQGQYPLYISPHDLSFKTTHISYRIF